VLYVLPVADTPTRERAMERDQACTASEGWLCGSGRLARLQKGDRDHGTPEGGPVSDNQIVPMLAKATIRTTDA
jgi:hypothetical protein